MDIKSLSNLKFNIAEKRYNLFYPRLAHFGNEGLYVYKVQEGEEMRIDLIMMSIYSDNMTLEDIDIILFINNIDNPLNIKAGDLIYYPPLESFETYRIEFNDKDKTGEDVRKALSIPNKTTKVDNNRKKFIEDGYSLPPVVLDKPKPPVKLEDSKIVIGGLN
jgi:hypothetical protein